MSNIVSKNKTANTGKYSYKYTDIAQIHEYLESKGWSYYQYIERLDGDDYVMTVRIINGEEKTPLRGARVVDAKLNGVINPAQEQGSALTYARRYSLLMAFGLATDDDDAQSLTRKKEQKPESKPAEKPEESSAPVAAEKVPLMTPLQKAKLRRLLTDDQWEKTISKFGSSDTWTYEQAENWISALERRNNNG